MTCVLDASFVVSTLIPDEDSTHAEQIIRNLRGVTAQVPTVWIYEIASALAIAEKSQRLTREGCDAAIAHAKNFPAEHHHPDVEAVIKISRDFGLSVYDASYLALCLKEALPLATFDKKMKSAAIALGISLLN